MRKILIFLISFFFMGILYADTHVADSLSASDVQNAIDAASAGDTVELPSGTATWDGGATPSDIVTVTTNNLTIIGQGTSSTILQVTNTRTDYDPFFRFDGTSGCRITGIKFIQTNYETAGHEVHIRLADLTYMRIDHCEFIGSSYASIAVYGYPISVCIDNCVFSNGASSGMGYGVFVHGGTQAERQVWDNMGIVSWAGDLGLGTLDGVYIEDCIFDTFRHFVATAHGARYCCRYCTITDDAAVREDVFDTHGAANGNRGCRKYEIYENSVDFPGSGSEWLVNIDSGTGVIWNNTITNHSTTASGLMYAELGCCGGPFYWDPSSTVSNDGWAITDSMAHGATADDDDATYVQAENGDTTLILEDSMSGTEEFRMVLNVWAQSSSGAETIDVDIWEGGDNKVADAFTNQTIASGSVTLYSYTLAEAEKEDFEDDWSDVRVHLTVNTIGVGENVKVMKVEIKADCPPDGEWQDYPHDIYIWGNTRNGNDYEDEEGAGLTQVLDCDDEAEQPFYPDSKYYLEEMSGYTPLSYPHPFRSISGGVKIKSIKGPITIK